MKELLAFDIRSLRLSSSLTLLKADSSFFEGLFKDSNESSLDGMSAQNALTLSCRLLNTIRAAI